MSMIGRNGNENGASNEASMVNERSEEIRQLVAKAGRGSREAASKLLSMYTPLIEASVSKFSSDTMSAQDREDLRQEAVSLFLRALTCYDGERYDVEFGLYAKVCISNGLSSAVRNMNRRHDKLTVLTESIDTSEDVHVDLLDGIVEQERLRTLSSTINSNLSELERKVWWLYVSGMSAKVIAEKLEKDEKSVSNAVYRIRQKLRTLLS
ncbi:MAG: sigma-70 family RNA polymerase sigma factor [Clostridia bacterium]|nr:sigma-70 family RNA polymerase sigma factor [Clostridia bacterium]